MTSIDIVTDLLGSQGIRFGASRSVGSLTVVPVFHEGAAADYRLLAQVAGSGDLVVEEVSASGSVPVLKVTNRGQTPVLLVEGEVLSGLKQTRTLNVTVLVPARSTVAIPVACVEQGRWDLRAAAPVRDEFHVSPRVRHIKNLGVQASSRAGRGHLSEQLAVWSEVDDRLRAHRTPSPTHSYSEVHRQRRAQIIAAVEGLRPEPGQRGVLALIGGRPAALDLFDRPETLTMLWSALVGSYAADALLEAGAAEESQVRAAFDRVHALAAGEATVHPGVGSGDVVQLSGDGAIASALVAGGAVIHLAALWRAEAAPPQTSFQRPSSRRAWFGQRR